MKPTRRSAYNGGLVPPISFRELETAMSTAPPDPENFARKQFMSAMLWVVLSAAIAVVVFLRAAEPNQDKKNFYLLAGVVAAIAAIMNGYSAWQAYKKWKSPPTA
jgi:hypothetical protein